MSNLLKSKFLLGMMVVTVMFVGVVAVKANKASAADCSITMTLKYGMTNSEVTCLQNALGVSPATGYFGNLTKAAVMAFQADKGLVADGVFGMNSRSAWMNGGSTTSTTSTTGGALCPNGMLLANNCMAPASSASSSALTGGAGEMLYSSTTTGLESDVKEGTSEKVLATKLEADGSDVAVSSVKVSFENNSGNGSTKLAKYIDTVDVMLGSTKVGSVDADEFSKDGDVYSKSIALSNAVIKDGVKATLYVSVETLGTVDEETAEFDGIIEQVRWMDATGAIFSDDSGFGTGATQTFGFDEANVDDSLEVKSSTSNPDDETVTVDDTQATEDVLGLVFKLDVDEDSSDVTVNDMMLTVNVSNFDTDGDSDVDGNDDIDVSATEQWADRIIEEVNVEIDGEMYEADLDDNVTTAQDVANGSGALTYTVDFEEEVVIDSGNDATVKVYFTFAEQDDAEYNEGVVVTVSLADEDDISAETENDELGDIDGSGKTGAELTLSLDSAEVGSFSWVVNSAGTIVDFFFTVDNSDGEDDFTFDTTDIVDALGAGSTADVVATTGAITGTLDAAVTEYSGDDASLANTSKYTVASGDSTRFRIRYSVGSDDTTPAVEADNGIWLEVEVTSVAGQTVDDDKETSPTATVSI